MKYRTWVMLAIGMAAFALVWFLWQARTEVADVQMAEVQVRTARDDVQVGVRSLRASVRKNDARIKEAVMGAVEEIDGVSDDDICDVFNNVISGARRRNSERRRAYSSDR